jgi:hypothetical protein
LNILRENGMGFPPDDPMEEPAILSFRSGDTRGRKITIK